MEPSELTQGILKFRSFLQVAIKFNEEAFQLAFPFFRIMKLKKGELFVEQDSTCRNFAFLVSGLMRSFKNEDGNEVTDCICTENAFAISTVSFITQTPSYLNIQALEDSVLLTISYTKLQELYSKSDFWQQFGKIIAEKELISLHEETWRHSRTSAMERYQLLMKENPGIINRIPLHFIASYLNIRPETLSRIRKKINN